MNSVPASEGYVVPRPGWEIVATTRSLMARPMLE